MTADFTVTLKQLSISASNVRTAEETDTTTLEASLLAHTQLHPLTVKETKKGKYEVIAGRRRFLAFQRLMSAQKITKDFPIKVTQAPENVDAAELSLVENVEREQMHPADEYEAFRKLIEDKGETRETIAERFGCTVHHINRRLKLAKVSPTILAAFRAGKLTLMQTEAYALSDDHAAQDAYYSTQGFYNSNPDQIRSGMKSLAVKADNRFAKFVGEDAYTQAGGTITRDLFSNNVYFDNQALLMELTRKKLAAVADGIREANGWKWVIAEQESTDRYSAYPRRLSGRMIPLSIEDETKRVMLNDALNAAQEAIDAHERTLEERFTTENGEIDEEGYAEASASDTVLDRLSAARDEAQEAVDAFQRQTERAKTYDPQEMQLAGVLVSVAHAGTVQIDYGMVRKEDVKYLTALQEKRERIEYDKRERERMDVASTARPKQEARRPKPAAPKAASDKIAAVTQENLDHEIESENDQAIADDEETIDAAGCEEDDPANVGTKDAIDLDDLKDEVDSGESDPLHLAMAINGELSYHLTAALRVELAQQHDVALRLLAFHFAIQIAGHGLHDTLRVTELRVATPTLPKEVEQSEAGATYADMRENTLSRIPGDRADLWAWMLEQDRMTIDEIIALGFASTITAHIFDKAPYARKKLGDAQMVGQALQLDMGRWWTPDALFFKRSGKKNIINALRDYGPLAAIADSQTRDMEVATLSKVKTAELAERAEVDLKGTGWLPYLLRTPGVAFNSYLGDNGGTDRTEAVKGAGDKH